MGRGSSFEMSISFSFYHDLSLEHEFSLIFRDLKSLSFAGFLPGWILSKAALPNHCLLSPASSKTRVSSFGAGQLFSPGECQPVPWLSSFLSCAYVSIVP